MAKKVPCDLIREGDYIQFNIGDIEQVEMLMGMSIMEMIVKETFISATFLFRCLPVGLNQCYSGLSYDELKDKVIKAYEKKASPELFNTLAGLITVAMMNSGLYDNGNEEDTTTEKKQ